MSITSAQVVKNTTLNNVTAGSSGTVNITLAGAGSTVLVWTYNDASTSATVTCADNVDGSYTSPTPSVGANPLNDSGLGQNFQFFILNSSSAGGARTVTVSWSPAAAFRSIIVQEVTGAKTSSALDGSAANEQTGPGGTNGAVVSGNTSNSNQPAGVFAVSYNGSNAIDFADADTTDGFTQLDQDATLGSCLEWERITSTGTIAAKFTASRGTNGSDHYITQAIVLDEALPGPTINTQPTNQKGVVGGTATFTVSATASAGSLTYLWKKNGSSAPGTNTNSSYITPTLVFSDNFSVYTVDVTDSNGTVTSNQAMLFVYIVPAIMWIRA